jgi:hypothetical protein
VDELQLDLLALTWRADRLCACLSHLIKAWTAIYRPVIARHERDAGLLAALRARGQKVLTLRALVDDSPRLFVSNPARWTASGLILESLGLKELLLSG